jgi:glycosyltransferase involved in cell wall biosynthesis
MLKQDGAEVIVVDYSCPEESGRYVKQSFPSAKVVSVGGKPYFAICDARNRGAAVASGEMLVFCDADTILAENAIKWISRTLPKKSFGGFSGVAMSGFNRSGLRLSSNQLRGFQVVSAKAFHAVGGYDDVLQGYAAGGDTDLLDRLVLKGFEPYELDTKIIEDVIEHENAARIAYHYMPVRLSYLAGLLYRRAKFAMIKLNQGKNLSVEDRSGLYQIATQQAARLDSGQDVITLHVELEHPEVGMPRQLGFEKATQKVYIAVEVSLQNRIEHIPD